MKNILYIAPSPSVKGGISTVIKSYLSSNLAKNHNIFLVSSHVDGTKFIKLIQAILGLIKTFFYLIFKKIDIVHIHAGDRVSCKRKFFYFKLVKFFSPKILYHVHGALLLDQFPNESIKWQTRIKGLFEESDIVICLSKSWRDGILDIAPHSYIEVVPNSVRLPQPEHERSMGSSSAELTFLGLIGERKGVFDLLKVLKRLIDDRYKVNLNIGGNGEIDRLTSEIKELDLSENVRYMGWISEKEKDIVFRKTDIFVLPSYGEGMPMSILEAMTYGIPVISTCVGGIPELVSDGETGFLINPGDLDALYEKIKFLIRNTVSRKKFGERGRLVIETNHNLDFTVQRIDRIYNSL